MKNQINWGLPENKPKRILLSLDSFFRQLSAFSLFASSIQDLLSSYRLPLLSLGESGRKKHLVELKKN